MPPAPPREPRHVVVDGVALVLEIARHRRARRYVLRMTDRGTLRLTVPRGASIAGGVHFVERQARWIRRERLGLTTDVGAPPAVHVRAG